MAECSDIINFDHTRQGIKFYMCRECKMHIALVGDNDMAHGDTWSINLETAVNLVKSIPEHYVASGRTKMAYMSCIYCRTPLGWQYVEVESPTNLIKEGRIILYLDRLLYWSGEQMEWCRENKRRNHKSLDDNKHAPGGEQEKKRNIEAEQERRKQSK